MRYGILGSTQAHRDDGEPVALGGVRLRALLAALALHPGRVRTVGALIGEVWDGDPPADAAGALQALVGRLRRTLGHPAVESVDGGYRLRATAEDVDLHRFEQLTGQGVRALADGDAGRAASLLGEALALWRGPALADLPDRAAVAARAESRRMDARRAGLTADLELGRAEGVLHELAGLCREHPLDEPLQALRLRALRDVGRTAEALAAYETVRHTLADRLGSDPGPELRALHERLLAPGAPVVTRAAADGAARDEPSAGRPGNLRARLTSFVGRHADLDALRGDLATARLITLLGPGGSGKTRLSQEAAEAGADAWPDGVWLAELAPVDDPATVAETVLTALGGREVVMRGGGAEGLRVAAGPDAEAPVNRLVERCAHRRMLILLDNCEHVVDAAAALAETLLTQCPDLTVLATSREPLGVPGEVVRPVDPLPVPAALWLLADRGAAARPGFRTDDDPEACAEICRRLDGLPLAVELAAARLRSLTPRQLAARLDDRFRLLTGGSRTLASRQQTLRAVVDWSWDLLSGPERAVLRCLSVVAGGCDLAAAEAVAGSQEVDPRDVAALLGSLVDKSLVVAEPEAADGGMRYRLLETVGEYAGERLDESGDRPAAERRHLVHYRELARAADPLLRGHDQQEWLARLDREHDNLRAALRRAVAARDEHEALCLVLSLGWFWQLRGHRGDARTWSEAAAALGPDPFAPPVHPAPPLTMPSTSVPPPLPDDLLAEARRGVRLVLLANVEGDMSAMHTPEAQRELRGLVASYRPGMPQTCRLPAVLWYYAVILTGDFGRLRGILDAAVRTCRELGYAWELAFTLQVRAKIANVREGDARRANDDADESLEIFTRLGDAWGASEALSGRGEVHELRGDYQAAAGDYREAVRYAEQLGAQSQVALLRARLAGVYLESDDAELAAEGERMLREVIGDGRHGHVEALSTARLHLALRCGVTGRTTEARSELGFLRDQFGARALAMFDGMVEGLLGWLDTIEGRPAEALVRVRAALATADDPLVEMVAPYVPVVQLLGGARALAVLGGPQNAGRAARLIGAYEGLRPNMRGTRMERQEREVAERTARAVLGDVPYERLHAEGRSLTLEEAAALV